MKHTDCHSLMKRFCLSLTAIVSQLSGRDAPRPTMTGASGYASFEFVNNGQIHYQVIAYQPFYS